MGRYMQYDYDVKALRQVIEKGLSEFLLPEELDILRSRLTQFSKDRNTVFFNLTFMAIPRLIKRRVVSVAQSEYEAFLNFQPGLAFANCTSDRLARVWWLLQFPPDNKEEYIQGIENLFVSAEMNEQVALYGALPLYAYPEAFRRRAAEGLRTSIKLVFEAIALDNPYPSEYLEEDAWNQMVLKSFFMNIAVNRIVGLDKRVNRNLAHILSDYAHERWSAGRLVNPLLWRPVGKYIDERIFPDILRLFNSENGQEREAAALACLQSSFSPALDLLAENPKLKEKIENEELSWQVL